MEVAEEREANKEQEETTADESAKSIPTSPDVVKPTPYNPHQKPRTA